MCEKLLRTAASGHQKDLLVVRSFQTLFGKVLLITVCHENIMSDYIAGDWHCLEIGHVHEFFK